MRRLLVILVAALVLLPGTPVEASRKRSPIWGGGRVPAGANPLFWKPATRPAGAPANPPLRKSSSRIVGSSVLNSCYPTTTAGGDGETACRNPGYYAPASAPAGLHWGDEPHYASGIRYLWILDSLTNGAARGWLNHWINEQNAAFQRNQNLPAYVLYQAEALGVQRGQCGITGVAQWVDVCDVATTKSTASFSWAGGSHLFEASVTISTSATSDLKAHNAIYHELGHAVGFAHDQNCNSVMTYCSTYHTQHLGYAADQVSVVHQVWLNHTN